MRPPAAGSPAAHRPRERGCWTRKAVTWRPAGSATVRQVSLRPTARRPARSGPRHPPAARPSHLVRRAHHRSTTPPGRAPPHDARSAPPRSRRSRDASRANRGQRARSNGTPRPHRTPGDPSTHCHRRRLRRRAAGSPHRGPRRPKRCRTMKRLPRPARTTCHLWAHRRPRPVASRPPAARATQPTTARLHAPRGEPPPCRPWMGGSRPPDDAARHRAHQALARPRKPAADRRQHPRRAAPAYQAAMPDRSRRTSRPHHSHLGRWPVMQAAIPTTARRSCQSPPARRSRSTLILSQQRATASRTQAVQAVPYARHPAARGGWTVLRRGTRARGCGLPRPVRGGPRQSLRRRSGAPATRWVRPRGSVPVHRPSRTRSRNRRRKQVERMHRPWAEPMRRPDPTPVRPVLQRPHRPGAAPLTLRHRASRSQRQSRRQASPDARRRLAAGQRRPAARRTTAPRSLHHGVTTVRSMRDHSSHAARGRRCLRECPTASQQHPRATRSARTNSRRALGGSVPATAVCPVRASPCPEGPTWHERKPRASLRRSGLLARTVPWCWPAATSQSSTLPTQTARGMQPRLPGPARSPPRASRQPSGRAAERSGRRHPHEPAEQAHHRHQPRRVRLSDGAAPAVLQRHASSGCAARATVRRASQGGRASPRGGRPPTEARQARQVLPAWRQSSQRRALQT